MHSGPGRVELLRGDREGMQRKVLNAEVGLRVSSSVSEREQGQRERRDPVTLRKLQDCGKWRFSSTGRLESLDGEHSSCESSTDLRRDVTIDYASIHSK